MFLLIAYIRVYQFENRLHQSISIKLQELQQIFCFYSRHSSISAHILIIRGNCKSKIKLYQYSKMRSIINAKFAVLFVHIIVVGSIFITKFQNIAKTAPAASWDSVAAYVNGFTAVTLAMIGLQLIFSLFGLPFDHRFLPLQLTLQIVALFSFSCFILMRLQYQIISYIWGGLCLIPFLLEIAAIVSQCLANRKYQLLDQK